MHYITDYQLDINKGFMCRVNGKPFRCEFLTTDVFGKHFYVSNILKVADAMGIARHEFIDIFNSDHVNHVIYCDSKEQCYDLCQIIVKTYFKPMESTSPALMCWKHNEKTFRFRLALLEGKYVWQNEFNPDEHIVNRTQIDAQIVNKELGINMYALPGSGYIGFDTKEDALKFAKYIKVQLYDTQEGIQYSRRHLLKYYYNDQYGINLPERSFSLRRYNGCTWYWHNNNLADPTNCIYSQFKVSKSQVLEICNKLNISCILHSSVPTFENPKHAIKFTDYLIETFIIKKEKTYDTNQLRKERTAISRGAKPAGSIIHGRRSKASVRCGCIEHKACLGN